MGKSTINGPFSMAMLNYQRVSFVVLAARAGAPFSRWHPNKNMALPCPEGPAETETGEEVVKLGNPQVRKQPPYN